MMKTGKERDGQDHKQEVVPVNCCNTREHLIAYLLTAGLLGLLHPLVRLSEHSSGSPELECRRSWKLLATFLKTKSLTCFNNYVKVPIRVDFIGSTRLALLEGGTIGLLNL